MLNPLSSQREIVWDSIRTFSSTLNTLRDWWTPPKIVLVSYKNGVLCLILIDLNFFYNFNGFLNKICITCVQIQQYSIIWKIIKLATYIFRFLTLCIMKWIFKKKITFFPGVVPVLRNYHIINRYYRFSFIYNIHIHRNVWNIIN